MALAIIVDGQNLAGNKDMVAKARNEPRTRINHQRLAEFIGNDPDNKYCFVPREPKANKKAYFDSIEAAGFTVYYPEYALEKGDDSDDEKVKELIRLFTKDDTIDEIVVVAGDGGYIDDLKDAQRHGKTTQVLATKACTNEVYINNPVFNFVELMDRPELFYQESADEDSKSKPFRNSHIADFQIVVSLSYEDRDRLVWESY